jgi:hypothetical protein
MEYFKGDETELKIIESIKPILDSISNDFDDFYENCYECYLLGGVIHDLNATPLANAIVKNVFVTTFNEIFQSFSSSGTFETYISIFKKIFGESAIIEFTIPAVGKLNINITADQVELNNFIARNIEDNVFILSQLITQDLDNLMVQSIKGFQTEQELETMLKQLIPAGIYPTISLTLIT